MSITYHERPGVYSDYDASSVTATGSTERVIALAGVSEAKSGLYTVTSYASGRDTFGESSQLGRMLKLAYQNGAGTVLACPVAEDTEAAYQAALTLLLAEKRASFCVVGSTQEKVHIALRDAVEAASGQRGECIGLAGMASPSVAELTARAAKLNSERVVLMAPDVYLSGETAAAGGCMAASALAGVLCDQSDPAMPLNGQVLQGISGVTAGYEDTEYDALVAAGVTALECVGGRVSVIRGLTTRTKTGNAADKTFRELTTILIVDDVIPSIRRTLRAKFTRAKNSALTRNAIRNQVIVELEDRIDKEIIEGYDNLTVTASTTDPTTCVVEFEFRVVHGLNRIYLTAHISV